MLGNVVNVDHGCLDVRMAHEGLDIGQWEALDRERSKGMTEVV